MKHLALAPLFLAWTLVFMAVGPVLSQGEPALCGDSEACNYNPLSSPAETAECDYCSCPEVQVPTSYHFESDVPGYGLRVDLVADHDLDNPEFTALAGMKTYRFYATVSSAEERVTAVFGSGTYGELVMNAPQGFYHNAVGSLIGSGIQSQLYDLGFPELQYDSWVTIGVDSDPNQLGPSFASITTIAAEDEDWIALFDPGMGQPGSSFSITSVVGGGWFTLPDSDNCTPDAAHSVLIGQFTTSGELDGTITFQALLDPETASGTEDIRLSVPFSTDGLGDPNWSQPEDCPCEADVDADGICEPFDACVDLSACNYDDPFNSDCLYVGDCGLCGGPGYPEGTCDCEGTPPDALGICGGSCTEDLDEDGVCDVIDLCVGELDDCGVCNGPGAVYDCGCNEIPECDCDCNGSQLDALGDCGGDCSADLDGDGVCDNIDNCIGALDACGICNGPGDIYDCGCSGIPAGECNCDGNQLDALGICGGSCTADVDGDGVCDDVDDCVGAPDACGICNGPGDIYDCGCSGIPAGDCDCDGNQLDALGICGGSCTADVDGDGVCDDVDDCVGAPDACGICNGPGDNYDCGCSGIPAGDCDCDGNQLDALGVCGGDCSTDLDGDGICDTDEVQGCTNSLACNYSSSATDDDGSCLAVDVIGECGGACTADADGDGVCDDVDDCVGTPDACGICNGPDAIYDCGCSGIPAGDCDCDGNQLDALGICGGSCTADVDGDGVCDDVDDCVGPLDACGICNGPGDIYDCGCSGIPAGDCDCDGNQLDALGICGGSCTADVDGDGVCDDVDDCVGTPDACGICNGPDAIYDCGCSGIPAGECDCDGNQLDALGICGGSCTADVDGDGVCDDVDDCVGTPDECGICNGPDAIYDCGCSGIPAGDCDCDGNQLDALGICGGSCTADVDGDGVCDNIDDCVGTPDACGICNGPGDIYDCGCSGIPAGDCDCDGNQLDALGNCGGSCTADVDGDGVCDDVDDCVGTPDACGICNGPDAIYDCGCSGIPAGDCDCDGNQLDALGICGGSCTADVDGDGVCDDVDDCVGAPDACGICNGPGAIYDCGCSGIPAGECDCDGNQLDALGNCGGSCTADVDGDGVCDDVDDCVGTPDACGICNGPGAVYDCGCSGIPAGDCDCDGNQLDALGICGGSCTADVDGDGVCDDVDDCVGTPDACGICNGPDAIYDCGCSGIPAGDCDCDGNQLDALGICGGDCLTDLDGDGICDTDEVPGCTNPFACNYQIAATDDDGSCLAVDVIGDCGGACTADADGDGVCDDVDDCVGTPDACGICNGPGAIYDCGCSGITAGECDCDGNQLDALGICGGDCLTDLDGDGICDTDEVPGCTNPLACNYSSSATDDDGSCLAVDVIGECGGSCTADVDGDGVCDDIDDCVGTPDACGICNGPGAVYDCGCSGIPAGECDCDGNQLDALGICGGSCTADVDGDGVCDDVDDCVGAPDACGICNGPGDIYDCGCSGIPAGDCDCDGNQLDALGICGGSCTADVDGDGVCDDVDDCVGAPDACGICNGPGDNYDCGCSGIPAGDCDCDGNQLDALGVCGGDCTADVDGDGVCDDVDDCVGTLDACGICNGPGAVYDCGCSGIPAGDCDCDGNQLDALGVCGGDCAADGDGDGVCDVDEMPGCTNPFACNYDASATDDDESCLSEDAIGTCGGSCSADADGDGICDDSDPCVGILDVCGVCNGPGSIYDCGCDGIPPGDCDCEGNQLDALGVCGGNCTADVDGDGVCDVDEVFGCVDPNACNFDPEATEQGGSCFYDDAIGVCGGACPVDADGDGICDTEDTCFGTLDACGVCNGPGAVFSCGCHDILPGACDCDGNMPDAIGVCDGECEADDNGNGVCDDLEASLCGAQTTWNPETGQCEGSGGSSDCPADLNGDGVIAVADLLMFLAQLGNQCPE